jgi:hypothetical protein
MTDPERPVPVSSPITSGGGFLLVVFRSLGAVGVMFVCAILLLRRPPWQLSPVDAVYWTTLLLLLVAQCCAAKTAGTLRAFGRTWWRIVAAALLVWLAAHSV